MSSQRTGLLTLFTLAAIAVTACQAVPAAPAPPAATAQIINPSEKSTAAAAAPTIAATTAESTKAPEATQASTTASTAGGTFTVNGVTMPFKRSETVIMDQGNYSVFDSFNPFIPNGLEFAAGWWQISNEYLWYVNYATGDILPWLADSFSYNKDYTELTIKINKSAAWNDGQPFTADDVVFTFQTKAKDPGALGNPDPDGVVASISAPDSTTVLYKFKTAQPRYHLQFWCRICTGAVVIPKHIWEKQDPKTFKNNPPVTTGPYMFDKAYLRADSASLTDFRQRMPYTLRE